MKQTAIHNIKVAGIWGTLSVCKL